MTVHETKIQAKPSESDLPPETFASLAHTIRQAKIRKLPPTVHDDLLVMFEALQQHLVEEDERVTRIGKEVEQLKREVEERERQVELKARAIGLLTSNQSEPHVEVKRSWWK
jgi:hypothetical protein